MKSGGSWNLRGLRPRSREAARRSGMSVGEWLNSVIARNDEEDFTDDKRLAARLRNVSGHRRDRFEVEAPPRGAPYRGEYRNEPEPRPPHREGRPPRKRQRERER